MIDLPPYIPNRLAPSRRQSLVVHVGNSQIGGKNPILVQSMTTTLTKDVEATARQSIQLARAGCELVRITAPTAKDAEALRDIVSLVRKEGVTVPFCADIHFQPKAAFEALKWVEKVRINPGNFVDIKTADGRDYTDADFERGVQKVYDAFSPLVREAKSRGVALRIGTNHGSLSDRMLFRFGDSVEGMVESALEYLRVCETESFDQVIFSMKASNPRIVIQAYRMLAARLNRDHKPYPFHVGVTEAGDGEDGRLKSAAGIGALLLDGIGDTIRVSLTEDPVKEIPVAQDLLAQCQAELSAKVTTTEEFDHYYHYVRRSVPAHTWAGHQVGGNLVPAVLLSQLSEDPRYTSQYSLQQSFLSMKPELSSTSSTEEPSSIPPASHSHDTKKSSEEPSTQLKKFSPEYTEVFAKQSPLLTPLTNIQQFWIPGEPLTSSFLTVRASDLPDFWTYIRTHRDPQVEGIEILLAQASDINQIDLNRPKLKIHWSLLPSAATVSEYRLLAHNLKLLGRSEAIVLRFSTTSKSILLTAGRVGSLLADGIGDLLCIESNVSPLATELALGFLQASGARRSKAEFVSCPSCGRTLFDLETTTQKIRSLTGHLSELSIAVMGCIVNGPGEMADADFGYVGGAPGKVNLFVGRDCVQKGIDEAVAPQALVDLIKAQGRWKDSPDA